MYTIEITDRQQRVVLDAGRAREAMESILRDHRLARATISLAVVDDPTIHVLNRQYLAHDYPTDVLSFLLDREEDELEGEVIVSADTAANVAAGLGWDPADELLLYIIHGTLHLVGHDDSTPELRAAMRAQERRYLAPFGLEPPQDPRDS